ncbi:MAG: sulfite exporter TauE/SafE family protein [Cardiobacteriaceae bacterium]|nr:sulfite exporter TauE/SafE family protein [Cardiobacteriaceae bacterium]
MLVWLVILNFLTSTMTAVIGIGGGMILIAFMPFFLPPSAIIPVHATTQLASNLSRAWFGRRHVLFPPLAQYAAGNVLGMVAGFWLIGQVNLDDAPLYISIYILLNVWVPPFQRAMGHIEHFSVIGFVQTVLALFVGVTGPMNVPLLMKRSDDHHAVVSTAAAMMVFAHLGKVVVYGWYGFAWMEYAPLLAALVAASVAGSWAGVRLRQRLRMDFLRPLLKYVLTALACYAIWRYFRV